MNPLLPTGAPAPPPGTPPTLNSIRTTYINLFNQILDSSININCICKTTQKQNNNGDNTRAKTAEARANRYPDDQDFMDDESDSDSAYQNDVEMRAVDVDQARQIELSSLVQKAEMFGTNQQKKICDLSCFENLKYIHNVLKSCFSVANDQSEGNFAGKQFEAKWTEFKFLSENPKSCDYYGTTIYHYAASDNNFELLKCIVRKYPDGVLCLDSKGILW